MYSWRVPRSTEPVEEAADRHVGEREEPVERDAVVAGEPGLPLALQRGLRAGQEGAGRVADERQAAPRVALAVARGVQPPQRLDRPVEGALAPLGVRVEPAVVGQGADDLDPARAEPRGQVRGSAAAGGP